MKIPYHTAVFSLFLGEGGEWRVESRFASLLNIGALMTDSLLLSQETHRQPWTAGPQQMAVPICCSPAVGHASGIFHFPLLSCQPEFMSFFLKIFQSILQKTPPAMEHFTNLLSALCKSQLK